MKKALKVILMIAGIIGVIYVIIKKVLPSLDDAIEQLEKEDPEFKDVMDAGRKAQAEKKASTKKENVKEITVDEIDKLFDEDDDDFVEDDDPDLFPEDKVEEKKDESTYEDIFEDDEVEQASLDDEDVIIPKEVNTFQLVSKAALKFIKQVKDSLKNEFTKHDEVAEYFGDEELINDEPHS